MSKTSGTDDLGVHECGCLWVGAGQDNKSPASYSPPVGMKEVADLKKTHFYGYHVATEDVWDVKQAVHPLLLQGNTNRPYLRTCSSKITKPWCCYMLTLMLRVRISRSPEPLLAVSTTSRKGRAAGEALSFSLRAHSPKHSEQELQRHRHSASADSAL